MKLWIRSRRIPMIVGVIAAIGILLHLGRGHILMVPTVIGGGGSALFWSTFAPLGWAVVLCAAFASVSDPAEQRPQRRLPRLDAGLYCVVTLSFCAVMTLADDPDAWREILAHTLILGGLAVAVTARRGDGVGIMVATATVLVTCAYGPREPAAAFICFLQPGANLAFSLMLGAVASGAALAALLGRTRGRGLR